MACCKCCRRQANINAEGAVNASVRETLCNQKQGGTHSPNKHGVCLAQCIILCGTIHVTTRTIYAGEEALEEFAHKCVPMATLRVSILWILVDEALRIGEKLGIGLCAMEVVIHLHLITHCVT